MKYPKGFKVMDDTGREYSKRVLSEKRAKAQMKALYAAEARGEFHQGAGYTMYGHGKKHITIYHGAGWFSNVMTKIKGVASRAAKAVFGVASKAVGSQVRVNYPPKVRAVMAKYGSGVVEELLIRRAPIQSFVDKALNLITFGKFAEVKQKYAYDKLFHLSMIVALRMPDGAQKRLVVEKNEVINIGEKFKTGGEEEYFRVSVPTAITFDTLISKGKELRGDAFFKYDAFNNNCQDFLISILQANGLLTPDSQAFIKQDVGSLLKELPSYISPFANLTTNIAGLADRVLQGEGQGKPCDCVGESKCGGSKQSPLAQLVMTTLADKGVKQNLRRMVAIAPTATSEDRQFLRIMNQELKKVEKKVRKAEKTTDRIRETGYGKPRQYTMPFKDYMAEHKQLIKVLDDIAGKAKALRDKQANEPEFKGGAMPTCYVEGFISRPKVKGQGLRKSRMTQEQRDVRDAEFAELRRKSIADMAANPLKYQARSYDPSEGGLKEPCWVNLASSNEKGGLRFGKTSMGYQTPMDCANIQQIQIDESDRRQYNSMSGFQKFAKGFVNVATKVADFAVKPLELVPGIGRLASQVYQNFAPPGSEYYGDNVIKGVQAMAGEGKRKRKGGRIPGYAMGLPRRALTAQEKQQVSDSMNPYLGQEMVDCPTIPAVKARDGAMIFAGKPAQQTERGRCEALIAAAESAMKTKNWRDNNLGVSGFVSGLSRTVQPIMDVASFLPVVGSVARGISTGIDVAKTATDMAYGEGKPSSRFMKQLAKLKISPATYLAAARAAGKKHGYKPDEIDFATDGEHKLVAGGTPFGRVGYGDFIIYSLTNNPIAAKKRDTFIKSHSKIKGDWKSDKYSANNLALRVLWKE